MIDGQAWRFSRRLHAQEVLERWRSRSGSGITAPRAWLTACLDEREDIA
jgi:hypothetical protein